MAPSGGKDWNDFAVAVTVKDDRRTLPGILGLVTGRNLNLREEQLE